MESKLYLPIFILYLFVIYGCQQTSTNNSILNLDFENIENGMPKGWHRLYFQPNYTISVDSTNVMSGIHSVAIEYTGGDANHKNNFQAIRLILPKNYEGEKITLSGYIKTENVTDGHAGLWMQIDPQIAYGNMRKEGVTGTTEWEKHEITLEMDPENTQGIILGAELWGKGKMWVDNLQISIDGKNIENIKIPDSELLYFGYKSSPAKNDIAFDNGSNIEFPKLTEQKINNLDLLGRIWGFLKYHHPVIADGKYNWDYELFRILPAYLEADGNRQRDKILQKWIHRYGRIPACETCQATSETAVLKPDLSWIDESDLNQRVKDLLHNIYLNRHQGNQYYVRMDYPYARSLFINENPYPEMDFPDDGFRLLALFRLWNMANYFFPYKNLTEKEWSKVIKEYIPFFINAKNRLEYELVSVRLIGELCDSHAILLEGGREIGLFRGYRKVPISIRFIEGKLVVTDNSFYSKISIGQRGNDHGLQIGDIITHIEGKSIEAIVDSIRSYYPASNDAVRKRDIANDLLRSNNDAILVDYISSGEIKKEKISTIQLGVLYQDAYRIPNTVKSYNFIDKNIGYINMETIKSEDIDAIKKEFIDTKGIIIDIRNYSAIYEVAWSLGSFFVSKDTVFQRFTVGNPNNPGEFNLLGKFEINKSEGHYPGKLVVIVDEKSQSRSESTAMAFRAGDNTAIIGSQTAGANGHISEMTLPGGLKTLNSGIGICYPDGTQTQRIGIVPDIWIEPTINGIKQGRDEVLEKAIEIIRGQ